MNGQTTPVLPTAMRTMVRMRRSLRTWEILAEIPEEIREETSGETRVVIREETPVAIRVAIRVAIPGGTVAGR